MISVADDRQCGRRCQSKGCETDLHSLDTLREAKRAIEVVMPREFVCPLKEHTTTLNAAFFREIEVVLARLAVTVRVICRFPLRQRLDNLRM